METIKKFVVIGPESTGKSTLCSQLAEHYHTTWVPEYAREYLEKNGMDYSYEDLLIIAKRQIELEESFGKLRLNSQLTTHSSQLTTHSSELLIIDTDMYVMKVWCEYVFDKCHNWVLNRIAERNYDGYLLCNSDLPWIKDNLR
jgi:NadR type nicotinamide-nucleotide adenylyltransferase